MVLKKQTVWLLTMLSLVIVLSVYYVTSPEPSSTQLAGIDEKQEAEDNVAVQQMSNKDTTDESQVNTYTSSTSSDEMFMTLRMQINEQRSEKQEQLTAVVASSEVSAEEKSKARAQMQEIETLAAKEAILETLIGANQNFHDVFVKAEASSVRVIVKAKELSQSEANKILLQVYDELGADKEVAIEHLPHN